MRCSRPSRGFSLIELLVVVMIIGILASIAVPQYMKVVERGRMAEPVSVIRDLRWSQERYLLQHGVYASQINKLDVSVPQLQYFLGPAFTVGTSGSAPVWTVVFFRKPASGSPLTNFYTVSYRSVDTSYASNDPDAQSWLP